MNHASRSRIAERAVEMRNVKCEMDECTVELQYGKMKQHLAKDCKFVVVKCKYSLLGCSWTGIRDNQLNHQQVCKKEFNLDDVLTTMVQLRDDKKEVDEELDNNEIEKIELEEKQAQLREEKSELELLMIHHKLKHSFGFNFGSIPRMHRTFDFDISIGQKGTLCLKLLMPSDDTVSLMVKIHTRQRAMSRCSYHLNKHVGVIFNDANNCCSSVVLKTVLDQDTGKFELPRQNTMLCQWNKDTFDSDIANTCCGIVVFI